MQNEVCDLLTEDTDISRTIPIDEPISQPKEGKMSRCFSLIQSLMRLKTRECSLVSTRDDHLPGHLWYMKPQIIV